MLSLNPHPIWPGSRPSVRAGFSMVAMGWQRSWRIASAILILAGSLGGCATQPSGSNPSQLAATPAKLSIVTTFLPITQFTQAVVGDRAVIQQLLPLNVGPHDYQAKPNDAQVLAKANVLVKNGLGAESFLEDMIQNAENPSLKIIDTSQGIRPLAYPDDAPSHAQHQHGKSQSSDPHSTGETHGPNPHIWLDPKRAMQQVTNIQNGLIAADPAGKTTYMANATAYIKQLQQLDTEFTQALRPHQGQTFVTYHDFATYFADSYNLKAEFLVGIPEENASPQDVRRVILAAQKSRLQTLLTEPQSLGSPFAALAKDLNVKISTFDPMETGDPQSQNPQAYLSTMRQNLQNLTAAFGTARQSLSRQGRFSRNISLKLPVYRQNPPLPTG